MSFPCCGGFALVELSKTVSRSGALTAGKGFTLVELLVVITIIVVLLALLTPALDKAIYQAELAVCGANLRGIAQGVTVYAAEHGRKYPARLPPSAQQPHTLALNAGGGPNDNRLALRPYLSMKSFQDPLTPRIEYDTADGADLYGPYTLWYSWACGATISGPTRMGSGFQWKEHRFSLLVADYDEHADSGATLYSNHQDRDGLMTAQTVENATNPWSSNLRFSISRWYAGGMRGTLDLNFAFQDVSVKRLDDMPVDDLERTVRVPQFSGSTEDLAWYTRLPNDD